MNTYYDGNHNIYGTNGGAYKLLALNLCTQITFLDINFGTQVFGKLPSGKWLRVTQVFDGDRDRIKDNMGNFWSGTGLPELGQPFLLRELNLKLADEDHVTDVYANDNGVAVFVKNGKQMLSVPELIIIEVLNIHPDKLKLDEVPKAY